MTLMYRSSNNYPFPYAEEMLSFVSVQYCERTIMRSLQLVKQEKNNIICQYLLRLVVVTCIQPGLLQK